MEEQRETRASGDLPESSVPASGTQPEPPDPAVTAAGSDPDAPAKISAPPNDLSASPTTAASAAPAAARGRGWKTTIGVGAALALAFAWGALAHRELSPVRQIAGAPLTSVAGTQAPPRWISDFATAFCNGDADKVVARVGPPLAGQGPQIAQALSTREWTCSETRFLGGGFNSKGSFYVWVTIDDAKHEQWWVFTVVEDKVIGID